MFNLVGIVVAKIAVEVMSQIVAVQNVGVFTKGVQLPFHQVGDGRFACAG
jgi:hypothetical protein